MPALSGLLAVLVGAAGEAAEGAGSPGYKSRVRQRVKCITQEVNEDNGGVALEKRS